MIKNVSLKALLVLALLVTPAASADELDNLIGNKGGSTPLTKSIPAKTAEQNIFVSFLEHQNYEKALNQWFSAFSADAYRKTDSGKALFGFLLFKNGLKLTGLQELFNSTNPSAIDNNIINAWKQAAPPAEPVWRIANIVWNKDWTGNFGARIEAIVRSKSVNVETPVSELEGLVSKAVKDSEEAEILKWYLALAKELKGDQSGSAKILKELIDNPKRKFDLSRLNLTVGRLLYERGFLDAALDYYKKVPKSSDDWFESQEEVAWSYLRKGEPQNALGNLQGLVIPSFAHQVGPETLYLKSLAHLKICDYPEVVSLLKDFKQRFKPRSEVLTAVAKSEGNQATSELITKLKEKALTYKDLGSLSSGLPRNVHRDEVLIRLVDYVKQSEVEAQLADRLYARSLSGGTEKVGFNAKFGEWKQDVDKKSHSARGAAISRVRSLAQQELTEIQNNLQKLHIVEAEMVQQIHLSQKVSDATAGSKAEEKVGNVNVKGKDSELIQFAYDGEVWMDEVSYYKYDIKKGCQAKR